MKQFILLGDEQPTSFEQWLLEQINELPSGIERAALILFPKESSDVGCYTAHFNMQTMDLAEAANHMLFDSIDAFIKANLGNYRSMEVDEDGCAIEDDFEYDEE